MDIFGPKPPTALIALFQIGFLDIRLLDLLDIFLVGLLLYQLYRLVHGSLAFNIFIGIIIIYLVALVVRSANMTLFSGILDQFLGVGVIALLIVFQPEVRRFLLYVGRTGRLGKGGLWRRFSVKKWRQTSETEREINAIVRAIDNLSRTSTGALVIVAFTSRLQFVVNTGVQLDARISGSLLESIFYKNSPLHDGAVIIADHQILAAKCVLPVTDNPDLPRHLGMRHRAAVGITEHSDALAIIVSEERGEISYAHEGELVQDVDGVQLKSFIYKLYEQDAGS